jgi:hypothetical protein
MSSDESHLMDAVARRVHFEGYRWNALEPSTADLDDPSLVRPGLGRGFGGGPRGDVALAQERGARVLIAGYLGDTIMFAWGLRRDLFRHGRWPALVRETVGRNGLRNGGRQLVKAWLGGLPPVSALWLGERAFGRAGPPPTWLGPRLREIYSLSPEPLDTLGRNWSSHLACELWARITTPAIGSFVDAVVQSASNDGLELRIPYADVRIIDRIFKIPATQRIERGAVWSLRHDTFGAIMPPEFRVRKGQPSWAPTFARAARRALPRVAEMLRSGQWLSAPYCDRAEVERWLTRLTRMAERADAEECMTMADLGAVEAWLRRLMRYDSGREVAR